MVGRKHIEYMSPHRMALLMGIFLLMLLCPTKSNEVQPVIEETAIDSCPSSLGNEEGLLSPAVNVSGTAQTFKYRTSKRNSRRTVQETSLSGRQATGCTSHQKAELTFSPVGLRSKAHHATRVCDYYIYALRRILI